MKDVVLHVVCSCTVYGVPAGSIKLRHKNCLYAKSQLFCSKNLRGVSKNVFLESFNILIYLMNIMVFCVLSTLFAIFVIFMEYQL